ncbi:hypothetical protein D9M72_580130 [compost metagenome]
MRAGREDGVDDAERQAEPVAIGGNPLALVRKNASAYLCQLFRFGGEVSRHPRTLASIITIFGIQADVPAQLVEGG